VSANNSISRQGSELNCPFGIGPDVARWFGWRDLVELYHLTMAGPSILEPRYNICPTNSINVVVRGGEDRALVAMRWGLVPSWWKKPLKEMRVATFNARSREPDVPRVFRQASLPHPRFRLLRMADCHRGASRPRVAATGRNRLIGVQYVASIQHDLLECGRSHNHRTGGNARLKHA
jgi:hypothetical protein